MLQQELLQMVQKLSILNCTANLKYRPHKLLYFQTLNPDSESLPLGIS
jgi:hypothetical protein